MILSSLPLVGQLYLPLLLTSLILGMIVLILLEKKGQRSDAKAAAAGTGAALPVSGGCGTASGTPDNLAQEPETSANRVSQESTVPGLQEDAATTTTTTPEQETQVNGSVQETTSASCSSSATSSGSEEEAAQPKGAARRPKKKHSCRGSVKICASKKPVTGVTILTDTEEEQVQVSLEQLAQQVRSTGLTCTILPLRSSSHQAPSITDPSHLLLLFGTTSRGCEWLREVLCVEQRGAPAPCMYSVTCWSEAARGDVYESAVKLSAALEGCGGVEWLPLACISPAGGTGEQSTMTEQQYIDAVLTKITKPKKCCGTSCSTKNTVDIEDLATSLLPPRPALKT